MKRFFLIAAGMLVLFSTLFVLAEQWGYTDEQAAWAWLVTLRGTAGGRWILAGLVIGLLVIDLLLPVPSSVVMTGAGYLLGLPAGALASFVGGMLAACIGFYGCRYGGAPVFRRMVGEEETARIDAWFRRWGVAALIASRPIPMLTEILSCLAGLTTLRGRTFLLANTVGLLPICLLYAWAGSRGEREGPFLAVVVCLLVPAIGWLITRWIQGRAPEADPAATPPTAAAPTAATPTNATSTDAAPVAMTSTEAKSVGTIPIDTTRAGLGGGDHGDRTGGTAGVADER